MRERTWVRSGVVESFDVRQQALLDLVLQQMESYYADGQCRRPLSLSRLARLCNRNGVAISLAVRILANSVDEGQRAPPIWYERVPSLRHPAKRYYRIVLR